MRPEIHQHEHMQMANCVTNKCMRTLRRLAPAFQVFFPSTKKSPSFIKKRESAHLTMPMRQANNESLRDQRILANCKKIWSHVRGFEIDLDCDDGGPWGNCQAWSGRTRAKASGPY